MKKNILIVDDDQRLRELIKDYLVEKNFNIFLCEDFIEAKDVLKFILFDLIILDRMMPTGDGINLISLIKQISNTPVIMLTAMGENENRIRGLKTGADDYLPKPFEPEELFLRIKNLLILYENLKNNKTNISFGSFVYNISNLELKDNGSSVYLTEGENNLLLKLIENRNNIVLREDLSGEHINENELRKVDVQITRLRQKLEINPKEPKYIKTIRGKGYKLICKELS